MHMKRTPTELPSEFPVVTDGAWGTQLQALGLRPGECPDSWNLSNPASVEEVARSYVEAGSRVILTNTFRANRMSLKSYNLQDRTLQINAEGVRISRKAALKDVFVFASMGPSGRAPAVEQKGEAELAEVFMEQAMVLAEEGADGILIEGMTDLSEVKIALRAARETGLPVAVSMVFDSGRDKDRTMAGNTPEEVAKELTLAGADIIGANCGLGIEHFIPVCKRLRSSTEIPIWIKPNAGLPELVGGRVVYRTTSRNFSLYAQVLCEIGASYIGGCCGTTPEFIGEIAQILKKK